jgi:predicted PurR-regulated permease PerM
MIAPVKERERLYATLFFAVLLVGITALSYVVLKPFFAAAAWGIVLAVAFQTPWRALAKRLEPRRSLAAALAASVIALGVLLPAVFLGGVLAAQASAAIRLAGDSLRAKNVTSLSELATLPSVARALEWVQHSMGLTLEDVQAKAVELGSKLSTALAAASGALVVGLLDALITFFTTIFLLFFLLRDGDQMAEAVFDLLPLADTERRDVIARLRSMLDSIFRGSLLCALIQGALGGVGWALAGLPSAILAGAVMGILSLLPIGGTAIVWLPGAIFLFSTGHRGSAIFLAVWGIVVTSFLADNVLKPLLISGRELNTLVVFLGVFGGLSAFGLLGLFIGPITLAAAVSLVGVLGDKARGAVDSRQSTVEGAVDSRQSTVDS